MSHEPVVKRDQIDAWIAELESRHEDLSREARRIEQERQDTGRQLALLRELLGEKPQPRLSSDEAGTGFRDVLLDIIRGSSEPMHLIEIRNALTAKGVQIPGRGTDANIIAHLRRLPGVHRISRGTYGTKPPDVGPHQSVDRKPRRRRRRRRRTSVIQKPV